MASFDRNQDKQVSLQKKMQYFRSVLPAWKFFSHLGPVPFLAYRVEIQKTSGHLEWTEWFSREATGNTTISILRKFFLNSEELGELLLQGTLYQFLEEILVHNTLPAQRTRPVSKITSYRILSQYVRNSISHRLEVLAKRGIPVSFQFRILAKMPDSWRLWDEPLFLSERIIWETIEGVECGERIVDGLRLE